MLIDYVQAHVDLCELTPELRDWLWRNVGDRVLRYCPKSGETQYEVGTWDRLRSDDHEISIKCGSALWVSGSPARCIGDGDTVFSAGASAALDIGGCLARMLAVVERASGLAVPDVAAWRVVRVDVTGNLHLPGVAAVKQALVWLQKCEGGRYRGEARYAESVNWGGKSRLRKAIAYCKGLHLRKLMTDRKYSGRRYSEPEITAAESLLRLELRLGSQWFHRNDWRAVDASALRAEWQGYFSRMFGTVEVDVMDERTLGERVRAVAKSEGRARAALACWCLIQQVGWHQAKALHSKPTWHRHVATLHAAGLGDMDISHGQVVPIRRVELRAALVNSWSELYNHSRNAA